MPGAPGGPGGGGGGGGGAYPEPGGPGGGGPGGGGGGGGGKSMLITVGYKKLLPSDKAPGRDWNGFALRGSGVKG